MTDTLHSREAIDQALAALRPFATCVYNDNGDVTLSGHLGLTASEFIRARRAYQVLERLRAHPSPGMPVYAPIKMSEIRLHVGEGSLPAWAVLEGVNIILRKRTDDARSAGNETPEALSPARSEEVPHNDLPLTSKTAQDLKSPLPAVDQGFPVASPNDMKSGWKYDTDFTFQLSDDARKATGFECTPEIVEFILGKIAALAGNAQGAEPVAEDVGMLDAVALIAKYRAIKSREGQFLALCVERFMDGISFDDTRPPSTGPLVQGETNT